MREVLIFAQRCNFEYNQTRFLAVLLLSVLQSAENGVATNIVVYGVFQSLYCFNPRPSYSVKL